MPHNIPILFGGFETGIQQTGLIEIIIKYNGDINKVGLQAGADIEILNENYAIATLDIAQLPTFYNNKEVEYFELPKNLTFLLRRSIYSSCISTVQSETGRGLKGRGVLVGIIDSGIDYTHPDFRNEDGTSRIISIWDQTISGSPPAGFKSGTEYDNSQLNAALNNALPYTIVPSIDNIGHGTAVAGVAAGNGRSSAELEMGIAPEASIIVVKLGHSGNENFARSTEIMRAIKYVSDKAEMLNMPVSINISYGTNNGSHDGTSLFETFIDSMSEKWKTVITVATGNEGSAGHHFTAKIKQRESINVEITISGGPETVYMTLWKNFADTFMFELISPGRKTSQVIQPTQDLVHITLGNVIITVFNRQPTHYNEGQEVYFMFQGIDGPIPPGIWYLAVKGEQVVDGLFDIWLPTIEEVAYSTTFMSPSLDVTLTLPSTARNVISVGGYNALIETSTDFSGRGYTRNNIYVKPNLVAPAVGITTTKAGGGYDAFSGTSIAAPFVTGSAALMMEWGIVKGNDPFLYGQRIKAFLQKGAKRKFSVEYPNPIWGYGALCLHNSINYLEEYKRGGSTI